MSNYLRIYWENMDLKPLQVTQFLKGRDTYPANYHVDQDNFFSNCFYSKFNLPQLVASERLTEVIASWRDYAVGASVVINKNQIHNKSKCTDLFTEVDGREKITTDGTVIIISRYDYEMTVWSSDISKLVNFYLFVTDLEVEDLPQVCCGYHDLLQKRELMHIGKVFFDTYQYVVFFLRSQKCKLTVYLKNLLKK